MATSYSWDAGGAPTAAAAGDAAPPLQGFLSPTNELVLVDPLSPQQQQHQHQQHAPPQLYEQPQSSAAQVTHLRRSVGQLEVAKATLERELHSAVGSRDLLAAELESLRTLSAQLERQCEEGARERAEALQEVALLNGLLASNQKKAHDEAARLTASLEEAIRGRSAADTEREVLRAEAKAGQAERERTQTQALDEALTAKQRMRELQEAQREGEAARREKDEAARLLRSLHSAAASACGLAHSSELPTQAEVKQCCDLLPAVHAAKTEDLRQRNSQLQTEIDRLQRELSGAKEENAMATRNQEARVQSHESSLKMAHSMIDDCKTQSSKLAADLERATADKQRFEREAQGLKAALDVCNDQLSAEKRARDAAEGEARERAGRQQAELRDARARAEKLQAELSATAKRGEEERGTLQQTRRQQAEQASYLESLLARVRSDLEVAQQETKTVVAERDYLKLELANLREQVGVLEGEAGALRQSLALCEQGRQRDVEANTVQQADLSHRVRCLEEDNRRLEGVLQKQRDMDKQAREKLTGVPVGSAVVVEQRVGNVKPILLGKKGIVIAHAVSPQGEAGALVGLSAPLGEELVLLANLRILPPGSGGHGNITPTR